MPARRGRTQERTSLFGDVLAVAEAATIAAYNRAEPIATDVVIGKAAIDTAEGEGASPATAEPRRILLDLTAKSVSLAAIEPKPKKDREPRAAKQPKQNLAKKTAAPARQATSKTRTPIVLPAAPPLPMPVARVRRRAKDPSGPGPGERWKRRLSPFAR